MVDGGKTVDEGKGWSGNTDEYETEVGGGEGVDVVDYRFYGGGAGFGCGSGDEGGYTGE